MDHRFGAGREGLVVAGEAPVHHDPTQTSLDNPASFNDMKAANSGVSLDDFDVDSEICAVLNDGVLEAGVDPALGDAGVGLLRLVEKAYSYGVFREARGSDGHCEEQADRVGEDASLPAYDLLRGVGSWLVRGMLVEVFTLWVSMTEAVGSGFRPSFTRARPVRS